MKFIFKRKSKGRPKTSDRIKIRGTINGIKQKKFRGKKVYHVSFKTIKPTIIFISKAVDVFEEKEFEIGDKIIIKNIWVPKDCVPNEDMDHILIGKECVIIKY